MLVKGTWLLRPRWRKRVSLSLAERNARGWGYWNNFLHSIIFPIFRIIETPVIYWISCSHLAGVTADTHEHDWKDLTLHFYLIKFCLTEKLTKAALVPATPYVLHRPIVLIYFVRVTILTILMKYVMKRFKWNAYTRNVINWLHLN